jgi:hypothetical protein
MAKKKEESMPQENQVAQVSNRDKYRNRYKEMYPELDMDNEDAFYESANSNLDELESYRKHNAELIRTFNNNKAFAAMLMAAKHGEDPYEWMAENLGADISELLSDPEYAKKISEATKKFNEAQAKFEASQKEYEANVKNTLAELQKIQAETGWDNEKCYDLASKVYDIIDDGKKGIITAETFKMVMNGMNFDTAVTEARNEGEVAGRNAKISEQLKKEKGVENMPPTLSTSKGNTEPKKKNKSFWEGTV